MHIYTPIRRVKKVVATTGAGKPMFGGPYQISRDLPIAGLAVILASSVAIAGFTFGRITGLATTGGGIGQARAPGAPN